MDAKYFAEIKARDDAELPETAAPVFRDRHALLAEVERLNKMLADSFQGQLLNELDAKDQQIDTLKKALELACAEMNLSDVEKVFAPDYFIRQAQEQEGKP